MTTINITGKVALVTGASRGIGKAIAHLLAQSGAYVFATATSALGVEEINKNFSQNGLQGKGLILNLNDSSTLSAAVEEIITSKQKIDILVNNAGITKDGLSIRLGNDEWYKVIDINLKSSCMLSQMVVRHMLKARTGSIINITSVIAALGNMGQANYAASKAGLVAFSKSIAREVGSRGIRVNCIAPGFIATDMTNSLNDEYKQGLKQQIPLNSFGEVNDIAYATLYLASDWSKYVTGSVMHVNGGMYMND